jgi:DNA polymerase I-like protein with 3'-5' exonuclease and polymerase domains
MTKMAMLKIYRETGRIPFMAVHDELNYGVSSKAEAQELQKMCETCVNLEVPVKADLFYGKHWK